MTATRPRSDVAPPPRRRPPQRRSRRSTALFVVAILAIACGVAWSAQQGVRAVLSSNDGAIVGEVTDPTAPGYEAVVEPTDSLLALIVDDDDDLVATAIVVPAREGGTILVAPPELLASTDDAPLATLADRYADGGEKEVALALTAVVGTGFGQTDLVDPAEIEGLLAATGDLEVTLPDALEGDDGEVLIEEGDEQLDPAEAALAFTHVDPGESSANRLARQQDLWQAWIEALRSEGTDDPPGSLGALDTYLAAVATGSATTTDVTTVPFDITPIEFDNGESIDVYLPRTEGRNTVRDVLDRVVPLPVPSPGSERLSVRIVNATDDLTTTQDLIPRVVEAGGAVSLIANDADGALATSIVRYDRPEAEDAVRDLADELDIDTVEFVEELPAVIDAVVVFGADTAG